MFLVTPAHWQDSLFAITLLPLAAFCLGLPIAIVWADAGYFTLPLMGFIRTVLKASFVIDYNLRRQGKRFMATLFFIDQQRFHLHPRATIERHFAWANVISIWNRPIGLASSPPISIQLWFTAPCWLRP